MWRALVTCAGALLVSAAGVTVAPGSVTWEVKF